jgi:Adenylate and Guanylate cyclase catalytic domain
MLHLKFPSVLTFSYHQITVADVSGFTAWSSIRDPHQVFTLLESIFQAFDAIAKRYGVYKVETVGDCYVGKSRVCCWDLISNFMCDLQHRLLVC